MSRTRAEALALMLVLGLMLGVLLVEYMEAVRPLPVCPESHCTLLPTGIGRVILGA